MKTTSSILFLVLIFSGCATPYQQTGLFGGFSETQLDENVWTVTFRGNGYTSRERATDFNLLRCAELCLENGYRYFVIVEGEEYSKKSSYTTPTTSYTTGSAYAYGNNIYGSATTQTYGGQTYNISKPRTSNTIVCFKEKPVINVMVYNAEFIQKSIREKRSIDRP
jgi:hypothetical protein